jgi:hypothetical protein
MRFVPDMKGVTPILSDVPPIGTVSEKVSDRGGNPEVYAAVKAGEPQHMAWAYERPEGGRGFGFTGLHQHSNLANRSFRTVLLNAAAWVTKLEIPEKGVPSPDVSKEEIEKVIDDAQAALKANR